jgi:predicted ABC-type ATPase
MTVARMRQRHAVGGASVEATMIDRRAVFKFGVIEGGAL